MQIQTVMRHSYSSSTVSDRSHPTFSTTSFRSLRPVHRGSSGRVVFGMNLIASPKDWPFDSIGGPGVVGLIFEAAFHWSFILLMPGQIPFKHKLRARTRA